MRNSDRIAHARLHFGVLGPLRAWRGDVEVDLGPARQRAVLATLTLRSPAVTSDEQILRDVWGDRLPDSGVRSLRSYVCRLRDSLGARVIDRIAGGYRLTLAAGSLDLALFHRLRGEARRLRLTGDAESSARRWRAALRLWRGEVLAGLPGPFAEAQRCALAELRTAALEECWEVELERGNHAEIVPELHAAVAEHPFREGLACLLMRSLAHCGRQADALDVFFQTRRALATGLGIDPSPRLQRLYQDLLVHSSAR